MIHDNQHQNEFIFIPVNVWQEQEASLSKAAPPLFFFFSVSTFQTDSWGPL